MTRLSCIILGLLALHATPASHAQEAKKKSSGILDTAKRLLEGNKDKVNDETRKKAEDAARQAMEAVPDNLKNKAQELIQGDKAAAARKQAIQTVKETIQSVRQDMPKSATPTETVAVARPANPQAASSLGPQAIKLQPLVFEAPPPPPGSKRTETVITAASSGFFDANKGHAIYRGNVKVVSPDFIIHCDELEIYLKKTASGGIDTGSIKPKTAGDADILATRAEKKATGAVGKALPKNTPIDMAYARGTMVTIEKNDPAGELQIAHCNEQAIFDGKTGVFTLRGWPSVQKGETLMEASDPRCYMILDADGKYNAQGGNFRTVHAPTQTATPAATPQP